VIEWGRYDYARWKSGWQKTIRYASPAHNKREIKKIEISKEGDGAFAVVDIDTLWISQAGARIDGAARLQGSIHESATTGR